MTSIELLEAHLDSRSAFWSGSRVAALAARKREEIQFHNADRDRVDQAMAAQRARIGMHENRKWYSVTESSRRYVSDWITRNAPGRVFLDYACGDGGLALAAASAGASLAVGLDISDVSVRNARCAAEASGLSAQCRFIQGDCEATELPGSSFDIGVCSGMLHHLDLDVAYAELARILRPGGRLLCVEALRHNPAIAWYRRRTPHMRTEWEASHILGVSDTSRASTWFRLGELRFWHLSAIAAVAAHGTCAFEPLRLAGDAADAILLRLPFVKRLAWQFTFELIRR